MDINIDYSGKLINNTIYFNMGPLGGFTIILSYIYRGISKRNISIPILFRIDNNDWCAHPIIKFERIK